MSDAPNPRITRRAFLAIIAAAGASACTGPIVEVRRSSPPGTPTQPASPTATATPSASPSASAGRFEPFEGETYVGAKRVAGRFVQALTTYEPGANPRQIIRAAARRADPAFDLGKVTRVAQPLFLNGMASSSDIVYGQLGGLTLGSGTDRCCVMVVVRQRLTDDDGNESVVTRTLDVRLVSDADRWRIEDLADAGPKPVKRSPKGLPEVARKVLEDTRIDLPDTARWDILTGDIDERLLTTMLDLAAVAPYAVAVLKTGHPKNVFGTDLVSGHTLGRGVDIWRIGGQPVVLQQPGKDSVAYEFTAAALHDLKVPELGSPWDLDGPPKPGVPRPSFTDPVHADHIHVAFKAP